MCVALRITISQLKPKLICFLRVENFWHPARISPMKRRLILLPLFLFLLPVFLHAQVVITEIMYDIEGSDLGREWIELRNQGLEPVTIKGGTSGQDSWRIYHKSSSGAESNKTFAPEAYQGVMVLEPGEYIIIVQNGDGFKNDYPDYNGNILVVSAMSLANTSMTVGLRLGSSGVPWSIVEYNSDWGAGGDGDSLQIVSDIWTAALPTPGKTNSGESDAGAENENNVPEPQEQTSVYVVEPKKTITVDAGPTKQVAIVGANTLFTGVIYGLTGEIISSARFLWSFGDGSVTEGKSVAHTYHYPGEYVVILEGSSGEYSASDKMTVTVVSADISIDAIGTPEDFFVSLKNDTKYEINLEGWVLQSGGKRFMIPANTHILSGKTVRFASSVTGLSYGTDISLLYPNGTIASLYNESENTVSQTQKMVTTQGVKNSSVNSESISTMALTVDDENILNEEVEFVINEQEAAVSRAFTLSGGITIWLFALTGLIIFSIAVFYFLPRQNKTEKQKTTSEAEKFTIIEEKE